MLPLLLLVLELAVVHQAADRGLRVRGNFYQVNIILFGKPNCFGQLDDAKLFAVDPNQAHLRCGNFTIDAIRLVGSDV
ncbi:hypothetical protein GCM10009097_50070 [Pigmentiphaga daeguensis]|uniref:Secreted protein n=1 Tax=Pigmentiphaga daeguensis TaxID=414049 RepID=A0ABP3MVL4_9BURK